MNLTLSPDDILTAQKSQRSILKNGRNVIPVFAVLVWAAVSVYLIENYLPRPSVQNSFLFLDLLLFPVLLVFTIYETILIHELGHLIAGLINRFEFNYLVVGPLKISKGKEGLKLNFSGLRTLQIGGLASLLPADEVNLRRRYLWVIAGGPLANILQTVIFLVVIILLSKQTIPFLLDKFLFTSFVWPTLLFLPSSIIPITTGGFTNDGARMRLLWQGTKRTQWHLQWVLLTNFLYKGHTPGQLDIAQLQALQNTAENEMEKTVASNFIYDFHVEHGDYSQAATALNAGLFSVQADPNVIFTPLVLLEAAYFVSQINQDAETARAWLDLAQKDYKRKSLLVPKESMLRAEAAVLAAEGEFSKAYEKAAEAMTEIKSSSFRPIHQQELAYLETINTQCLAQLDDILTLKEIRSNRRTAWAISKSFLKLAFLIGSIFFCVGCLIIVLTTQLRYDIIGSYYEIKGDDARALQIYEDGMASLDEPNSSLLNSRGEILMRQGKLPEALIDFDAAIEADPELFRAYMNRGLIYLEMGLYPLAVLDLDKSLELGPSDFDLVDIYFARAASLSGISEFDLAAQDYDRILEITDDPDEIELATYYRNLVLGLPTE